MTNLEIRQFLEPWTAIFASVMQTALRDADATIELLGVPRRVERATLVHAAARKGMRHVAEKWEDCLSLVEEPEGDGLDYLLIERGDNVIALRWSRFKGARISRNATFRQQYIEEQQLMPHADDDEVAPRPTVTLGYTIEDDFTEAGRPCWWIGRLVLVREKKHHSDVIDTIARFEKAVDEATGSPAPSARVEARKHELKRLDRLVTKAHRQIG